MITLTVLGMCHGEYSPAGTKLYSSLQWRWDAKRAINVSYWTLEGNKINLEILFFEIKR